MAQDDRAAQCIVGAASDAPAWRGAHVAEAAARATRPRSCPRRGSRRRGVQPAPTGAARAQPHARFSARRGPAGVTVPTGAARLTSQ